MSSKKSWRECIRDFSPAWFTVIMGTGITSTLIHNFPYGHESPLIRIFTLIIYFLNLVLFVVITGTTVTRHVLYPDIWSQMLRHPSQSLFLGGIPMGFCTLINVALDMNQEIGFGGRGFLYFLWGCWWLDSIVSFLCAFGVFYAMSSYHMLSFSKMAAIWILPIVALIVASSTGGLLGAALHPHSATLAFISTAVSLSMVIMGLGLALMMMSVYLMRLIVYGPPDPSVVLSAIVVIGPFGQGGYSMLVNGANLAALFPVHNTGRFPMTAISGELLYSFAFCVAYIFWSMGICWLCITLLSIYSVVRQSGMPKFGMAYWGLIFPNGVYTLLSVQLGVVMDSPFFRVFGALWSCITFTLWAAIAIRTIPAVIDRSIFSVPSLAASPALATSSDPENGMETPCSQSTLNLPSPAFVTSLDPNNGVNSFRTQSTLHLSANESKSQAKDE